MHATALNCSVVKLEQTSPTAGEPAVSSAGMKSSSPTSTKKAWRQRLEMGAALEASAAALATVPVSSSAADRKPVVGGRVAAPIQQSQLFVCRKCGKCFITLKYLEMHDALHACQLSSTTVQVTITSTADTTHPFNGLFSRTGQLADWTSRGLETRGCHRRRLCVLSVHFSAIY